MRDLSKWKCPSCENETGESSGRKCKACGYIGDWVQPGELLTYADNKRYLGVESITELLLSLVVHQVKSETEIAETLMDVFRQPKYR